MCETHGHAVAVTWLAARKKADYEKLDQMVAFANSRACRQKAILQYFGDNSAANCNICDRCQGKAGWPTIPALEAQRDAWFNAPDAAAEAAAGREMQRIAFEQVPYVPTGMYYQPTAYRRNLTGMLKGQPPLFWNIRRA